MNMSKKFPTKYEDVKKISYELFGQKIFPKKKPLGLTKGFLILTDKFHLPNEDFHSTNFV